MRGFAEAFSLYSVPTSAVILAGNAEHVGWLDRLYSIAFNGRFSYHWDEGLRKARPKGYYLQGLRNAGWFVILAYSLVLILGLFLLLHRSSSSGSSLFRVGDLSGFHGRFRAAAALT